MRQWVADLVNKELDLDFLSCKNILCNGNSSIMDPITVMGVADTLGPCLTQLFPIYQNKHWTIRQRDNHTIIPSLHRIILKIVGFLDSTLIRTLLYETFPFFGGTLVRPQ